MANGFDDERKRRGRRASGLGTVARSPRQVAGTAEFPGLQVPTGRGRGQRKTRPVISLTAGGALGAGGVGGAGAATVRDPRKTSRAADGIVGGSQTPDLSGEGTVTTGLDPKRFNPLTEERVAERQALAQQAAQRQAARGDLGAQGAFTSSGERIRPGSGEGTVSTVSLGLTPGEQQILDEFRAKQQDKIARTRASEANTLAVYEARKQFDKARENIERAQFLNEEPNPADLAAAKGAQEQILGRQGIEQARIQAGATEAAGRARGLGDIAAAQQRAQADQFNQQLNLQKYLAGREDEAFQREKSLRDLQLEERRLGGTEANVASQIANRTAQRIQDNLKIEQSQGRLDEQKASGIRSLWSLSDTVPIETIRRTGVNQYGEAFVRNDPEFIKWVADNADRDVPEDRVKAYKIFLKEQQGIQ